MRLEIDSSVFTKPSRIMDSIPQEFLRRRPERLPGNITMITLIYADDLLLRGASQQLQDFKL